MENEESPCVAEDNYRRFCLKCVMTFYDLTKKSTKREGKLTHLKYMNYFQSLNFNGPNMHIKSKKGNRKKNNFLLLR